MYVCTHESSWGLSLSYMYVHMNLHEGLASHICMYTWTFMSHEFFYSLSPVLKARFSECAFSHFAIWQPIVLGSISAVKAVCVFGSSTHTHPGKLLVSLYVRLSTGWNALSLLAQQCAVELMGIASGMHFPVIPDSFSDKVSASSSSESLLSPSPESFSLASIDTK